MDDHAEGLSLVIWVVAGTKDARLLIEALLEKKLPVIASVVTEYGEQILREQFSGALHVQRGAMDLLSMETFVQNHNVNAVIDASHPYARVASENLIELSCKRGIPYLRYERPESALPAYEKLTSISDWSQTLLTLQEAPTGSRVFLATGSRALPKLVPILLDKGLYPIVRILPDPQEIQRCLDLGLTPNQIIAMQGPFSYELNRAMFLQTGAQWLVTKESGTVGGADEKMSAAMELGMGLIVLTRPALEYPALTQDVSTAVGWAAVRSVVPLACQTSGLF
ncbi:precorrin-6A reductase [Heliobacillus mobilis]|uniref:Precorrin-6A reductase n=1 Tax=Heliobacterium mobile TaxID=28064 RepID=A0A6I3SMU3_HELMO|nr:precorrin-6A reductase [Heliobacterium mobile]